MMIVETGEIIENSNSYVSLDYASSYFANRGETSWEELEDSEKEVFLIKATDYIDNIFDWQGIKETENQCLEFPRKSLIDKNGYKVIGIPDKLKQAVCVACLTMIDGTDLYNNSEANGAVISEHIGQISFTYDVSKKPIDETLYQQINVLLRGLYRDKSKRSMIIGGIARA